MELLSAASSPIDGHRLFPEGPADSFTDYEELVLADGLLLRRYADGAVRLENPTSGVIQEERINGQLLVSLPGGKVVSQKFIGEPLLVYDTSGAEPPGLARVSSANLPGDAELRHVYHFQDRDGGHVIDINTLRYYRLAGKSSGEVPCQPEPNHPRAAGLSAGLVRRPDSAEPHCPRTATKPPQISGGLVRRMDAPQSIRQMFRPD